MRKFVKEINRISPTFRYAKMAVCQSNSSRMRTSGFRKVRFHKPVCTADSVYTSQLFNHGESCTRGSRQFARNNGSDAGSTSVNRMSSGELAIAAMKMPTVRYGETWRQRKFIVADEVDRLRIFDKDGNVDNEEKFLDIFAFTFCVFAVILYHRNHITLTSIFYDLQTKNFNIFYLFILMRIFT